ncbi:MAG: AAA family ATPase [Candidatus Thalassarchaeaceae archaeon]
MEPSLVVALTGSPGVGKTTIAALAANAGWTVTTVTELAGEHGMISEIDDDGAQSIDIEGLASAVKLEKSMLIDGHLSHLLPVDASVVIRCSPSVLTARLQSRDYPIWKIESNVEWEMVGGPWGDKPNGRAAEFDATDVSPDVLWMNIETWLLSGAPDCLPQIDWLSVS